MNFNIDYLNDLKPRIKGKGKVLPKAIYKGKLNSAEVHQRITESRRHLEGIARAFKRRFSIIKKWIKKPHWLNITINFRWALAAFMFCFWLTHHQQSRIISADPFVQLPQLVEYKPVEAKSMPTLEKIIIDYPNDYAACNCTWYVASVLHIPPSWGNANNWDNSARAAGYVVSPVPKVGAVAQTKGGWLGHVAVVREIKGSQVLISEMNYNGPCVTDDRWIDAGEYQYIYV